jgi:F-type H+-transporting ATPase subunit gamma
METLESLRRRIKSAEDLYSIVKTMKALAAVSIRQYEKAVEALAEYNRTTQMGLHVVLSERAQELLAAAEQPQNRVAAIIFGSDQGMCGQFNEQITAYTLAHLNALQPPPQERRVLCVGIRLVPRLEEARQEISEFMHIPGSVDGITASVQDLLLTIDRWREESEIGTFYLFYNRPISSATYSPHRIRLLPVDLEVLRSLETKSWPSRSLPTYSMDQERLIAALIRQHLFVSLFRAFAESLSSENTARLTSMQAAERNIEERLAELNAHYHDQRQNTITSELLDIVSGFEVLTGEQTG